MEKVLPHVDTMLHDHKLTIPERHKKWTGAGNERILANFKKAYETFPNMEFIARTPLIPGDECRRGPHPGGAGVHPPSQERD